MKAIFDRESNGKIFPLGNLLHLILASNIVTIEDTFRLLRIGGIGDEVWRYESEVDEGHEICLRLRDIISLAQNPNVILNELYCSNQSLDFGISDSSFMFIQAIDKQAEQLVAKDFNNVRDLPDRKQQL